MDQDRVGLELCLKYFGDSTILSILVLRIWVIYRYGPWYPQLYLSIIFSLCLMILNFVVTCKELIRIFYVEKEVCWYKTEPVFSVGLGMEYY